MEVILCLTWSAHNILSSRQQTAAASSPAYSGSAWAAEFWKEESQRSKIHRAYVPFRVWGNMPWHGRYSNNDESEAGVVRRTVTTPSNACLPEKPIRIWIFGGSAVYGLGVPDWATLPSYLSRDLNRPGQRCVTVTNFGVEGYVSNQDLIFFMERLKADPAPDIAIFYDGVNDTTSMLVNPSDPSHSHFSLGTIRARVQGSPAGRLDFLENTYTVRFVRLVFGLFHQKNSPLPHPGLADAAIRVVDNYEGNMRMAKALAQGYHLRLFCFFQPSLYYGDKPLDPFERRLVTGTDQWSIVSKAVYEEAARRAKNDHEFVFLGNLFDTTRESIYIDPIHTGPRGNEIAAQTIERYIAEDSK